MKKKNLRPFVDIIMTLLLLMSMSYELIGSVFEKFFGIDAYEYGALIHEYVGTAFILVVFFHLWLNRKWLMNIFNGKYNPARAVLVISDLVLIADIILILISGIMMSRVLSLDFSDESLGMSFARTAHMLASYWGYVIMSFHVGLHVKKFPAILFIPALYGIYAFFKRQIHEYMFLITEFAFFDFDEPLIFFFIDYICVMILFAFAGFFIMKACRKC